MFPHCAKQASNPNNVPTRRRASATPSWRREKSQYRFLFPNKPVVTCFPDWNRSANPVRLGKADDSRLFVLAATDSRPSFMCSGLGSPGHYRSKSDASTGRAAGNGNLPAESDE